MILLDNEIAKDTYLLEIIIFLVIIIGIGGIIYCFSVYNVMFYPDKNRDYWWYLSTFILFFSLLVWFPVYRQQLMNKKNKKNNENKNENEEKVNFLKENDKIKCLCCLHVTIPRVILTDEEKEYIEYVLRGLKPSDDLMIGEA